MSIPRLSSSPSSSQSSSSSPSSFFPPSSPSSILEFYHDHCTYLPAMLGWFLFSSLLSSYNKYVFGNGHMAFPCPLLLTSIHFLIQWGVSHWVCEFFPQSLGTNRIRTMPNNEWIQTSIPCGMVTSLDVGLSNLSLKYITLTFYTMVKSSTPIFVLIWAYIFGIERITWPLIGVIAIIAAGEFLTVLGEVDFILKGFVTCLVASILSGARWTLVQLKLQTMDPPLKSTLVTMRLLSPSMFGSMILLSMVIEEPWTKFGSSTGNITNSTMFVDGINDTLSFDNIIGDGSGDIIDGSTDQVINSFDNATATQFGQDFERIFFLGAVGGFLAVAMVLCEFYLILHSTAMILMIGGVLKELITIFIGVSYFGDILNLINVIGICVVFSGVCSYKVVFHYDKERKRKEDEERKKNVKENVVGKLLMDGKDSGGSIDFDHDDDNDNDDEKCYTHRTLELVDRSTKKNGGFSKMTEEIVDNNEMTATGTEVDEPLVDNNNGETHQIV